MKLIEIRNEKNWEDNKFIEIEIGEVLDLNDLANILTFLHLNSQEYEYLTFWFNSDTETIGIGRTKKGKSKIRLIVRNHAKNLEDKRLVEIGIRETLRLEDLFKIIEFLQLNDKEFKFFTFWVNTPSSIIGILPKSDNEQLGK